MIELSRVGEIPVDNLFAFCGGPALASALYVAYSKLLPPHFIDKKLISAASVSLGMLYTATALHNRPLELKFENMTIRALHGLTFTICSALVSLVALKTIKKIID